MIKDGDPRVSIASVVSIVMLELPVVEVEGCLQVVLPHQQGPVDPATYPFIDPVVDPATYGTILELFV